MPRLLGASSHRRVPWRNGLGVTDEILVVPHPSDPSRFAWRLSIALVSAAAPFSSFPGVDRTLILLEGAGMRLRFGDGAWTTLSEPFSPIRFAGETPVECELLAGPVRDFNVMVDRAVCGAAVECVVRELVRPDDVRPAGLGAGWRTTDLAIVALAGSVIVACPGQSLTLSSGDAVRMDPDEARRIESIDARAGAAAVARITAR